MDLPSQHNRTDFWDIWTKHQNYFYIRCLKWMNGNAIDAEDLLSQAMLKAWNKWPDYAEKIVNPKAWITQVIHNLCVDLHRQRQQIVQDIETLEEAKNVQILKCFESPEGGLFCQELRFYLKQAIETLPTKLRDAFILRYCQEKSYKEIASRLSVSEDAIYKRVQHAIVLLRQQLDPYFWDEDNEQLFSKQYSVKPEKKAEKSFKLTVKTVAEWQEPIATNTPEKPIDYNVSVLCLPILSRAW